MYINDFEYLFLLLSQRQYTHHTISYLSQSNESLASHLIVSFFLSSIPISISISIFQIEYHIQKHEHIQRNIATATANAMHNYSQPHHDRQTIGSAENTERTHLELKLYASIYVQAQVYRSMD